MDYPIRKRQLSNGRKLHCSVFGHGGVLRVASGTLLLKHQLWSITVHHDAFCDHALGHIVKVG